MDAVTHPEVAPDVIEHFVPLKLQTEADPDRARAHEIKWLPGQVVLQPAGRVEHRWIGFLGPDSYRVELLFGRAMVAMSTKDYEGAGRLFGEITDSHPRSARAPEAWYWWGVSEYRRTKDFQKCVAKWGTILQNYPQDQWAEKIGWIVEEARTKKL